MDHVVFVAMIGKELKGITAYEAVWVSALPDVIDARHFMACHGVAGTRSTDSAEEVQNPHLTPFLVASVAR